MTQQSPLLDLEEEEEFDLDFTMNKLWNSARWKKSCRKSIALRKLDNLIQKIYCTLCGKELNCAVKIDYKGTPSIKNVLGADLEFSNAVFWQGKPYCSHTCKEIHKF